MEKTGIFSRPEADLCVVSTDRFLPLLPGGFSYCPADVPGEVRDSYSAIKHRLISPKQAHFQAALQCISPVVDLEETHLMIGKTLGYCNPPRNSCTFWKEMNGQSLLSECSGCVPNRAREKLSVTKRNQLQPK